MTRARIGVLVSGRGSNLRALLDATADGRIDGDIVMVTGNKADCGAMEIARQAGVPRVEAFRLPDHGGDLATRDRAMAGALRAEGVELLVTAGYDRVLHDDFLDAFPGAILNLHPSLLPDFAGGMDAIAQAHRAGVAETGVTVHLVERGQVDAGAIVAQQPVPIHPGDSLEDLETRVHAAEHSLLPRVVQEWIIGHINKEPSMRAILSVFDKTGLVEFAQGLAGLGFELYSTGGTRRALDEAGVPVRSVSDLTGFPEVMDGRVKTLHPGVHGGILADRRVPEHMTQLNELGLQTIDLVAVNLYPFEATVAKPGVSFDEAVENIDIGGPTMIRAAAKNHNAVAVVVNPEDYSGVLEELGGGGLSESTRFRLATRAFEHTSAYDSAIAAWMREQAFRGHGGATASSGWPRELTISGQLAQQLRYGENPHQQAALYRTGRSNRGIANAEKLQGIELSYNNIVDLDAAWALAADLPAPAAAIIKHTNPCGTALGTTLAEAYQRAYECDTTSAFGGIIALNAECDAETARLITSIFVEGVIAPGFTDEALTIFASKPKVRVLKIAPGEQPAVVKLLSGGFLAQQADDLLVSRADMRSVGRREPSEQEWEQLVFAWRVVKHVKSNAIVLAKDLTAVGVGAGQMSRVESVQIAATRAGDRARGTVMASDAFFPMPDGIEAAAAAGVTAVIQPGGSIKDADVLRVTDDLGLAMVYTGHRHFRH